MKSYGLKRRVGKLDDARVGGQEPRPCCAAGPGERPVELAYHAVVVASAKRETVVDKIPSWVTKDRLALASQTRRAATIIVVISASSSVISIRQCSLASSSETGSSAGGVIRLRLSGMSLQWRVVSVG